MLLKGSEELREQEPGVEAQVQTWLGTRSSRCVRRQRERGCLTIGREAELILEVGRKDEIQRTVDRLTSDSEFREGMRQ